MLVLWGRMRGLVEGGTVAWQNRSPRSAWLRLREVRVVRFLHTADWQIGRQYGQFEVDDAAMLAEARLDAVATVAREATARGVDAVLVAGDVFDTQAVSDRTIRRLFAALSGFKGPWVLIAGNHDAALADSVWTRARQLDCIPDHVLIPSVTEALTLCEGRLCVLAAPLTQRHTYDDVTEAFDALASPPGALRVGLAHGSVTGQLPDAVDSTNPIAADRAVRARLDYLALGDWHGALSIDARTWYAGTPEQDRFRGNAPGYALEVTLEQPGALPQVTRVPIGRYRWRVWEEHLMVPADAEALAHRLDAVTTDEVVRLVVTGHVSLAGWEQLETAVAKAAAQARSLRLDASALVLEPDAHDLAALGAGSGYLAEVVAQLQTMQDDPAQAALSREALRLLAQFQREDA